MSYLIDMIFGAFAWFFATVLGWVPTGPPAVELVLKVEGAAPEIVLPVLQARARSTRLRGLRVEAKPDGTIVVGVPANADVAQIKPLLLRPGRLEFADVVENGDAPGRRLKKLTSNEDVIVASESGMSGDLVLSASQQFDENTFRPSVNITLKPEAKREFAELTRNRIGKSIAVILDGEVIIAPRVVTPIEGGQLIIQGDLTTGDAVRIAGLLTSGVLPAPVSLIEERVPQR
jgi:preprotein translocase subunit SecD